jgi:hypothetical protein
MTGSFMSDFNESAYPLAAEIAERVWFFSVGPKAVVPQPHLMMTTS